MLKQRQQRKDYTSNQDVEKYFSVKADLSFKQNTKCIPRGKIIRNQINRSNGMRANKLEDNKIRTLTPQCKGEQDRNRKKSQQQDIRSFKLEQSNVNSKYLTIKRELKQHGSEKTKKERPTPHTQPALKEVGNGIINLNQGWVYKGEYNSSLFHGYGELLQNKQVIYKGKFEYGYFHGQGKLQNCQTFNYLVNRANLKERIFECSKKGSIPSVCLDDMSWIAYIGQFERGELNGFGQLWMKSYKIVGNWEKGKLKKKVVLIINDSHQ